MGGYNSGSNQPRSCYGRADLTWALDVRRLKRQGWLEVGRWGEYRPGLSLVAKEGRLTLIYVARVADGRVLPIGEEVELTGVRRACRGEVQYFLCPGEGCSRRVAKLYKSAGRYRCRSCSKLAYSCQYEGWLDRGLRRRDKIEKQLGLEPGQWAGDLEKPKGMRSKTFRSLCGRWLQIEHDFERVAS